MEALGVLRGDASPVAPEHLVPPPAGQQHLPAEPLWGLLVPAVHASAGVTQEAVPRAVAQAMPAVPNFGHAPLRLGLWMSSYDSKRMPPAREHPLRYVLDGDGVADVVTPGPIDVHLVRTKAFFTKPELLHDTP